ncbi:MAG TPA: cupredoxin domain-containing protein [Candidatus Saccharimonadales bacterium]|nr:cupredoxin domain-containing protein [Candidatus Saccharimonadales bacterium]
MSGHAKMAIAVVVIIALGIGGYLLMKDDSPSDSSSNSSQESTTPSQETQPQPAQQNPATQEQTPAATITYTDSGFEPAEVTINSGDSLKVVNNSSSSLDFESSVHPVHTDNPELNIGSISPGSDKTFKITKTGTWGYHNHENPSDTGRINVE